MIGESVRLDGRIVRPAFDPEVTIKKGRTRICRDASPLPETAIDALENRFCAPVDTQD
jgi:hypothetical protein